MNANQKVSSDDMKTSAKQNNKNQFSYQFMPGKKASDRNKKSK